MIESTNENKKRFVTHRRNLKKIQNNEVRWWWTGSFRWGISRFDFKSNSEPFTGLHIKKKAFAILHYFDWRWSFVLLSSPSVRLLPTVSPTSTPLLELLLPSHPLSTLLLLFLQLPRKLLFSSPTELPTNQPTAQLSTSPADPPIFLLRPPPVPTWTLWAELALLHLPLPRLPP